MRFKDILIDGYFVLNGKICRKMKTVWEDCCNPLFNAIDEDGREVYVSNATPVKPYEIQLIEPEVVEDQIGLSVDIIESEDIAYMPSGDPCVSGILLSEWNFDLVYNGSKFVNNIDITDDVNKDEDEDEDEDGIYLEKR